MRTTVNHPDGSVVDVFTPDENNAMEPRFDFRFSITTVEDGFRSTMSFPVYNISHETAMYMRGIMMGNPEVVEIVVTHMRTLEETDERDQTERQ